MTIIFTSRFTTEEQQSEEIFSGDIKITNVIKSGVKTLGKHLDNKESLCNDTSETDINLSLSPTRPLSYHADTWRQIFEISDCIVPLNDVFKSAELYLLIDYPGNIDKNCSTCKQNIDMYLREMDSNMINKDASKVTYSFIDLPFDGENVDSSTEMINSAISHKNLSTVTDILGHEKSIGSLTQTVQFNNIAKGADSEGNTSHVVLLFDGENKDSSIQEIPRDMKGDMNSIKHPPINENNMDPALTQSTTVTKCDKMIDKDSGNIIHLLADLSITGYHTDSLLNKVQCMGGINSFHATTLEDLKMIKKYIESVLDKRRLENEDKNAYNGIHFRNNLTENKENVYSLNYKIHSNDDEDEFNRSLKQLPDVKENENSFINSNMANKNVFLMPSNGETSATRKILQFPEIWNLAKLLENLSPKT